MASNQTANLGLNQWQPGDQVVREEFNADNAKIDAALGGLLKMACGTYTGNGSSYQVISLPFTPKLVYVCRKDGVTHIPGGRIFHYGGLAVEGAPATTISSNYFLPTITIQAGGFRIHSAQAADFIYASTNETGTVFHYFALG